MQAMPGTDQQEDYLRISRLIIAHLTGALDAAGEVELEAWVNASEGHLRMMAEFGSVCWHARQTREFEDADKRASWARIQEEVARLPGAPPLPDLRQPEWTVGMHPGSGPKAMRRGLRLVLFRRVLALIKFHFH
jgi:hypothetical protein